MTASRGEQPIPRIAPADVPPVRVGREESDREGLIKIPVARGETSLLCPVAGVLIRGHSVMEAQVALTHYAGVRLPVSLP